MAEKVAKTKKMSSGAMLGIVIVVLVIVFGGIYYTMNKSPVALPKNDTALFPNAQVYQVQMISYVVIPQKLTINVGDTINWTNKDYTPTTVTSDSGSELNSPEMVQGASYSHQFLTAGTYGYHSTTHSSIQIGTVIVQ